MDSSSPSLIDWDDTLLKRKPDVVFHETCQQVACREKQISLVRITELSVQSLLIVPLSPADLMGLRFPLTLWKSFWVSASTVWPPSVYVSEKESIRLGCTATQSYMFEFDLEQVNGWTDKPLKVLVLVSAYFTISPSADSINLRTQTWPGRPKAAYTLFSDSLKPTWSGLCVGGPRVDFRQTQVRRRTESKTMP